MKNKKDLLGGVIVIVLLLVVLVTYMSFYNLKNLERIKISKNIEKYNKSDNKN